MVRYAITAGEHGLPAAKTGDLLDQIRHLADTGVDCIQLREKHLQAGELAHLTREILAVLVSTGSPARLLLNSRTDVALATGAHGVHLPAASGTLCPTHIRRLYLRQGLPVPTVSKSCHTFAEVLAARQDPPDLILFSPVFGKSLPDVEIPAAGLPALATACAFAHPIPVLALGGVTAENTQSCVDAGAAGVAGIRLFRCN